MKYSFSCPAPFNYEVMVGAKNDDEAVDKIIIEGAVHGKQVHPDTLPMTEEQLRNMVRSGIMKAQSTVRFFAGAVLAFWLALIFLLGVEGAFVQPS